MMRTRLACLTPLLATALLAAACTNTTGGAPSGGTSGSSSSSSSSSIPPDDAIGTLQHTWKQFDSDLGEAVLAYKDQRPSPILIKDQSEYNAWLVTLPAAMQPDVEDVTLDEEVAVVGYYSKCMEVSWIANDGDGEISFEVAVPPEHEGTLCGAAPLHIELWIIELDEIGVNDPDAILLTN